MSNTKHYPTHPGAEYPPIMTCEIPLEEYESLKRENEELKAKLEDVQATAYAESVDAGMENRRLKRALWLARAERAYVTTLLWNVYCYQNNCLYFRDFMNEKCNPFRDLPKKTAMEWSNLWESIETKCRAKAEEYR